MIGSGVSTNGLVFSMDPLNLKSYVPPVYGVTSSSSTVNASFDMSLIRVNDSTLQPTVVAISGDVQSTWSNIIANNGGYINLNLSGGATPESYVVNTVYYDSYINLTLLHQSITNNPVTMTNTGYYAVSMDTTLIGPSIIRISGNLNYAFGLYISQYGSLSFNLTGGATPETYVSDAVYFDGTYTYLYDNGYVGAQYTDHTDFQVDIPEIIGTLYNDNTVATYSYIDPIGGTSSYDLTQLRKSGVLTNGVGYGSKSFTFDGIDDNIIVGSLGSGFSSVTLDIWFNSSSITDYKNLIDFNGFNTCIRIEQYTAPGYFGAWSNLGGGSGYARMSVSINLSGDSLGIDGDLPGELLENTWYNLIVTYNSTGQKVNMFLNGVKIVNQYTCSFPFVGYINDLRIGDGYDYSSRRFQGKISYVGLYNRAISDTEALGNYNALKWRFI